jgi:chromosomal replication initiation ATPase DnaA
MTYNRMKDWKPWTPAQSAAVKARAAKVLADRAAATARQERKEATMIQPEKLAPISKESAREMREAMVTKYEPVFNAVRDAVCAEVGADPYMIGSLSRHPKVVAARMILVYLMRAHTPLSFPQIQELIIPNSTSHSTAVTQLKRLQSNWERQIHAGDLRTFKEVAEAFDPATLTFREASK